MSEKSLQGRVALVTGASRGIGRAICLGLAEAGCHVIAAARTVGGLEELDDLIRARGGSATLVPIDLRDLDAVDRFEPALRERWGRLDILIGNAGLLGPISPLPHVEPKVFDEVFKVNVTANYRLIRALDPLLRVSDAGRAVFLTSGAARRVRAFWGCYAASKAALEAMVRAYAQEVMNITNVRVMLVNPGPVRTAMRAAAMPGEDAATLPAPEALVPDILRLVSPDWQETARIFDFPDGKTIGFDNPA